MLVGPSGSGKTTAMRLINRMIPLSGGDILLGGRSVLDREPNELRREIGYVIQQIGLFPHLTVSDNIATVPQAAGVGQGADRRRVSTELLELIGLDPAELGPRYPAQLSGGQRQRVGVARALAADPPLMLMDEPFGAIDPINRARLQDEFLAPPGAVVRKTVVFVTHDIDEAIKMGDKIAILREGGHARAVRHAGGDPHQPGRRVRRRVRRRRPRAEAARALDARRRRAAGERNGARPDGRDSRSATTVRDALSQLLAGGARPLTVVDERRRDRRGRDARAARWAAPMAAWG